MYEREYDVRNCQSLLGYAAGVHLRSGGICQLCGYGGGVEADFDLWRQLTVEHLIGAGQGGYPREIRNALQNRFPDLTVDERERLTEAIDQLNTISACSFCNSTTSRDRAPSSMTSLIAETTGGPVDVFEVVQAELVRILKKKQADVSWKLSALRKTFAAQVGPALRRASRRPGNSELTRL